MSTLLAAIFLIAPSIPDAVDLGNDAEKVVELSLESRWSLPGDAHLASESIGFGKRISPVETHGEFTKSFLAEAFPLTAEVFDPQLLPIALDFSFPDIEIESPPPIYFDTLPNHRMDYALWP